MKIKLIIFSFLIIFTFGLYEKVWAKKISDIATIQGVLLKSTGKPLPYTEIELVPLNSSKIINNPRLLATSSYYGKFSFFNVPSGKYTLSINFDDKPTDLSPYPTFFYPNTYNRAESEIFEINEKSRIRNINFQLPLALTPMEIVGNVVAENGITVEDAYISVMDIGFDIYKTFSKVKTDANGNFKVKGFKGRSYQIVAILFEKAGKTLVEASGEIIAAGESKMFTLDSTTSKIKIVLKESEDLKKMRQKYIGKLILEK